MITGRRRRFHEVKDRRWFSLIRRQTINTKIQGSAADLMKIAMLKLDKNLKSLDSHILVQIHDEVLVEVPIKNIKKANKVIVDTMESALKLRVPLRVGLVEGDHWVKG